MLRCSHCGELVNRSRATCPECSAPIGEAPVDAPAADEGWFHLDADETGTADAKQPAVTIARFGNAAEAGYFAHELHHTAGIPTMTRVEENFDAVSGLWSARFVLAVPESQAESATVLLRGLIEQTDTDEFDGLDNSHSRMAPVPDGFVGYDSDSRLDMPVEESGVHWVPIVLTLAAGSVAFWGVRKLNEQPQAQVVPAAPIGQVHEDLWDHLSNPTEPWIQQMPSGRGVRELRFDLERNRALIREDREGDGVFEREFTVRR